MKRSTILILTILLLFVVGSGQSRTNRIFRPCPNSTVPAKVEVDVNGGINASICSGRSVLIGDDVTNNNSIFRVNRTFSDSGRLTRNFEQTFNVSPTSPGFFYSNHWLNTNINGGSPAVSIGVGSEVNLNNTSNVTTASYGIYAANLVNGTGTYGQMNDLALFGGESCSACTIQDLYALQIEHTTGDGATITGQRAMIFLKNTYQGGTLSEPKRDFAILSRVAKESQLVGQLHLNNSTSFSSYGNVPTTTPLKISLASGQTADAIQVNANYVSGSYHVNDGTNLFAVDASGKIRIASATPATAADTCTVGTITWDTNFIYVCIAANTWKRAAITAW